MTNHLRKFLWSLEESGILWLKKYIEFLTYLCIMSHVNIQPTSPIIPEAK